ncbi:MAG: hypothetical protein LBG97_02985 [Coriobacteriales bacterium]|jgi:biofilm protein TabA|nr:hypothetical protein [Coriobacteriales bacterium]
MRKIAFVNNGTEIKKVMIYDSGNGVYLFGYTTMLDCNCIWDEWYENLSDAEARCSEDFGLSPEEFIAIADPLDWCNHDYIMPVKIKGRELRKPEFDKWEILRDGKWQPFLPPYDETQDICAMTVNERLNMAGLLEEFKQAKHTDKAKARKILSAVNKGAKDF